MIGTIKNKFDDKGYGYIVIDNYYGDVYFHANDVEQIKQIENYEDKVEYWKNNVFTADKVSVGKINTLIDGRKEAKEVDILD